MSAELDPPVAKSGEHVFAKLRLKNIYSKEVVMTDSDPQLDYEIVLTGAAGKEPVLSGWGEKNAAGYLWALKQSELRLARGQEAEVRIEVTKAYEPIQPETYSVRIGRFKVWTEVAEDNEKVFEVAYANPVVLVKYARAANYPRRQARRS